MSYDNPAGGRLIIDHQSPRLRETLWDLIRQAKGDDVLAPVTVVGPTRYANLSLRHELGRNGFANVRFIVLPALAELLGAASLSAQGRTPLTGTLESVSMRSVLFASTGRLEPVRSHSSTQASIRATFRELRKAPEEVLDALEKQEGVRSEVVRLYRDFREATSREWYDAEDLTDAAANAVERGDTPGLDDLGLIVFYLPYDISPAQIRLVETLARRGHCAVLLGKAGDDSADARVDSLVKMLEPVLNTYSPAIDHSAESASSPGETSLRIAPNAHEELRLVIREIMQLARESGTPFHRMAVVYRADHPYGTLVPDELRLADIPTAGPSRESLADSGVGRTLLGLLDLADGEFRRADVMDWLTGCPVRPAPGAAPGFNPSHWDSLTRKAGIVRGLSQWTDRLERLANDLIDTARDRLEKEEITEGRAERMRYEATAARNAAAFIAGLAIDLAPPTNGSTWATFCKWAEELLGKYLSREAREENDRAVELTEEMLEGLKAADSINPSATLETFRQTVTESMNIPVGQLGPTGAGVFVSSLSAARGMSFDAIWLVGMIEGAVPPSVRPDPLIPESGWLEAGGESRADQRVASERYEYLSALASAAQRTLSYPVADAGSQRQAYPSRWFLEQASALEGKSVHTSDLPNLQDRSWLTTTDSGQQALSGASDIALADRHDYVLRRLLDWRRSGERISHHPLVSAGGAARSIRAGASRNQRRLTEFDGNLVSMAGGYGFQLGQPESPVSPTRLESWATCPFSYFLGNVLRLGPLETPEEVTTISALDRGGLVHAILERFIAEEVASGQLPAPGEFWQAPARDRLFGIANSAFSDAERRGVTGKHLLWQLAKRGIVDDLESFLEEDARLRMQQGTSHVVVEAEFGSGGHGAAVADPDTQVHFRGKIDRVDVSGDGRSVLVLDYKTGSARPYERLETDVIDAGRRLQLGVYSLAAQQLVPEASSIRAAYWFATNGGGFQFAPKSHFDIADSSVADRFRRAVSSIVAGIRNGLFPANPGAWVSFGQTASGPENCRFCDFDSLCPSRRIDQWERKRADPILETYLSLSSSDEGQQG